jgi:carbonic anhydrase/acetyltransferase-like protein (isoleucine patch superfamily)
MQDLRPDRARPGLLQLEARDVPTSGLVASAAGGQVILSDLETGDVRRTITAFDGFTGAVQVVLADVTDDGTADLVVAAGPGGGPRVRVLDGVDLRVIRDFFAFDPSFTGGVSVAAGDVTGDNVPDVIVGAGAGGAPHVRAVDVRTGREAASFFAFAPTFAGGVSVAAVDLTGDGVDEVVTGAGAGGGPQVRAVDVRTGREAASFFAFDPGFTGGVSVAGADPDGRGFGRIVAGAGAGGGPLVRAFEAGRPTAGFFAGDAADRGGVAVAAFAANQEWWIVTGQTAAAGAAVRVFDGTTAAQVDVRRPFGSGQVGRVGVAAAQTLLGPVLHADTSEGASGGTSFVDPSAVVSRADRIDIGFRSFVGPFAVLDATAGPITVGDETNVQDNVELTAGPGGIVIGDRVILAHNATVLGDARIGATGGLPTFVGFNAVVDGATVEPDAFVNHLTRLAPGVVLRSGVATLVGKFIRTQAEADDPALGKVTAVTDGIRAFMAGVLGVHEAFSAEYPRLVAAEGVRAVRGVGANIGGAEFSPTASEPTLHGAEVTGPEASRYRNRVVGHVHLEDTLAGLSAASGVRGSIRADEGQPFEIGAVARLGDLTTFHALVETEIRTGDRVRFGSHVVVHGGPDDGSSPRELTVIGDDVTLGDWAVAFRSTIGAGSRLGFRSHVEGSQLAPGTVVPDRAVVIDNVTVGFVEW